MAANDSRGQPQATEDISLIDSAGLIGREARLTVNPETTGQIVRVINHAAGRTYVFSYWWDGNLEEVALDGFQLELM